MYRVVVTCMFLCPGRSKDVPGGDSLKMYMLLCTGRSEDVPGGGDLYVALYRVVQRCTGW